MKRNRFLIPIMLSAISCLTNVHAEITAEVTGKNEARFAEDGLGVEMKLDGNGNILSVKSTYYHPVEFPDRRGINKAYIIAEEKAKANIARFKSQLSHSTRLASELDSSNGVSTHNRAEGGTTWSKENTRKVSETLTEITGSSSQFILTGIKIIERSYDEKREEVMVTVGSNRDTMAAAAQLGNGTYSNGTYSNGTYSNVDHETHRVSQVCLPNGDDPLITTSFRPSYNQQKQRPQDMNWWWICEEDREF